MFSSSRTRSREREVRKSRQRSSRSSGHHHEKLHKRHERGNKKHKKKSKTKKHSRRRHDSSVASSSKSSRSSHSHIVNKSEINAEVLVDPDEAQYVHSDREADMDLETELTPISQLADDGDLVELLHQVFLTLRGSRLRSLIPDPLQSYSLLELRQLCLVELEAMSRKRITRILQGDVAVAISSTSSEVEEEELQDNTVPILHSRSEENGVFNQFSATEFPADSTCDAELQAPPATNTHPSLPSVQAPQDVLELEMRARAILAMINAKTVKLTQQDSAETP